MKEKTTCIRKIKLSAYETKHHMHTKEKWHADEERKKTTYIRKKKTHVDVKNTCIRKQIPHADESKPNMYTKQKNTCRRKTYSPGNERKSNLQTKRNTRTYEKITHLQFIQI